jgi:4-carboxymuconolactone decarboxylase
MTTDPSSGRSDLFEQGLEIRREVLGADYVHRALDQADSFNLPFQHFLTEWCWGACWGRAGLQRDTRSMLNIAMLAVLNRQDELKTHVRAALGNGVTEDQIREVLIQVAVYAGIPAAVEAFRTATAALKEQDDRV